MNKLLILTTILAGISTSAIASSQDGHKGRLSFIPKMVLGKDVGSDSFNDDDKIFRGLNADILYGVTNNFEVGANISWVPYAVDIKTTDVKSYDETINALGLMGVMRYGFNQFAVAPYISTKAGWIYGDSEIVEKTGKTEKTEGQWAVGIAVGLEYKNYNLELGYQITEFKKSIKGTLDKNTFQEKLAYLSIGYRFK
jgi:hypothetical protein